MAIGEIFGKTSTHSFKFRVTSDIKKWEYVAVAHPYAGLVLGQVTEITKSGGETTADCMIIGHRTERGFLRKPGSPLEPGTEVNQASDELIKSTLGLTSNGLYIGLIEGKNNLKAFLDPKRLLSKHLAILAKSGAGKCVHPSTKILLSDGTLIPAEELLKSFKEIEVKNDESTYLPKKDILVKSLNSDLKGEDARVSFAYKKKCNSLLRIKTASGREMLVTEDHPIMSIQDCNVDYVLSKDLTVGQHIAAIRKINVSGEIANLEIPEDIQELSKHSINHIAKLAKLKEHLDAGVSNTRYLSEITNLPQSTVENYVYGQSNIINISEVPSGEGTLMISKRAIPIQIPQQVSKSISQFLALIIAEGSNVNKPNNVYRLLFTNKDIELVDKYKLLCNNLFGLNPKQNGLTYYIDSYSLKVLLELIGYSTTSKSREKRIPAVILKSPNNIISEFLRYMFECEGTFYRRDIQISSASKSLICELAVCLSRFDIQPLIKTKFKKATNSDHKGNEYYEIIISGQDNLKKFQQQIGFVSKRKSKLLDDYLKLNKEYNTNRDIVPNTGRLLSTVVEELRISHSSLGKLLGYSGDHISRRIRENRNLSRNFVGSMARELSGLCSATHSVISDLANSDIYWDKVVSIEKTNNDRDYVLDFTVEKNHNFIADTGLIVHNSYSVGVLLEELISLGVPVVILDPHGEYNSIKHPNKHPEDKKYLKTYDVTSKGFAKNLREYSLNPELNPETAQIKLNVPNDTFSLVEALPFKVSPAQKGLLYNIVNDLVERKKQFSFRDLRKEIEFSESSAKWRLIGGLQSLEKSGLFSFSPTPASDLVKSGQMTIINFRGASIENQEVVAQSLLTNLFTQRKLENIPPFFLIIEEAHNFCPDRGFGETKASKIIRTIASEGRKFGLGLCIISQRPARVDKSTLSQCTSQIALQITNPNDLHAISNSFEGITSESEREIKSLPIGKALVIGASDYPVFVDIRVRRSQHGGRSKAFDTIESPRRSLVVKTPKEQSERTLLTFEPRVSKNDVKKMETLKVKSIKLVLRPCLSLNCSKNNIVFQLVVDMINFNVYRLRERLEAVKVPSVVTNLSPIQKQVLVLVNNTGQTNVSEIFVKTKLGFGEVNSILNSLVKQGLISVQGKTISSATGRLNLSAMKFDERPRFMQFPDAVILKPKITEVAIINFVQSTGIKVSGKRIAYMPFYKVETSKESKITDAMSCSLTIKS